MVLVPYFAISYGFNFEKNAKAFQFILQQSVKQFADLKFYHFKGNVKKHVAKQHGENAEVLFLGSDKYSCTICEFTSGLKGELSKHIREVHDGKQNWICKLCDVQFTRKSNLQEHVR